MQKKSHILVAVILVLVITLAFIWQKERDVPQQMDKGQDVSPSIQTVSQEEHYPQHITEILGTDNVWYAIPEIDVRFVMPRDMAEDLIYAYSGKKSDSTLIQYEEIGFSSKTLLSAVGKTCSPEGDAIGSLTRILDKPENSKGFADFLGAKKGFKDFYVRYDGAQAVCARPDKLEIFEKLHEEGVSRFGIFFHSQGFINSLELTK